MKIVADLAPSDDAVVDYDRRHLAIYAALLEAEDAGHGWQHAATTILNIDIVDDCAEHCWRSHINRARWIIGNGLGAAILAFGERPKPVR